MCYTAATLFIDTLGMPDSCCAGSQKLLHVSLTWQPVWEVILLQKPLTASLKATLPKKSCILSSEFGHMQFIDFIP